MQKNIIRTDECWTMRHTVHFLPHGETAEVDDGTKISDAASAAGVKVELPCGGKGRCGRCIVTVSDKPDDDQDAVSERVLACMTEITKDLFVTVPQKEGSVVASDDHRRIKVDKISPLVKNDDEYNYGLAIDIGTTTLAVSILDMKDGLDIYAAKGENPQRLKGEDVLTRIQYAEEGGTDELRKMLLDSLNDMIDICLDRKCSPNSINAAYISGNTTMIHLFLGVDPSPIRAEPYEPVVREAEITGKESGLRINPEARVICMPSVSAYVGGDMTSGIVFSGMDSEDGTSLLIDVGTNGEVALGNKEVMMVCSSSAGPAFEGGNISSGMLAKRGAIDSVRIENGKIEYTTIASSPPKGICGSGLIDLMAEMYSNGWIDKKGGFTEKADTEEKEGMKLLRIADDVAITQKDIDTIMMTKAAIYSSAETLVKNLGVNMDSIEKIYIAGGFGNFIDLKSAVTIGLFPDVPREKYHYIGNASLGGAKHALLSARFRARIAKVFKRMTYIDLSSDPVFFEEYMSAQFIPHTDKLRFPSVK